MALWQKAINFDISLTKLKFCPKHVSEVPDIISRAFEREINIKQIQPIIGTDHVKEWVLREDSDIPEFFNAPNIMQEWIAEKLIRVKIPKGIMPKNFQPKKVKILATGNQIAKFFGEDNCSTRQVQCSLKIFECKHFYLKQTLPGSGASPHWTIFEGRWQATDRGLRLEYLLRYSWQLSSKPTMDFSIEAVKQGWQTSLAWDGETEKQLNGNLPAVVGTDEFFWAELVSEGNAGEARIRWNEDCPEPPSWKRREKPAPKEETAPPAAQETSEGSAGASLHRRRLAGGQQCESPRESTTAPASGAQHAAPPPQKDAAAHKGSAKPAAAPAAPIEPDTESPVPLYIGFAIFILVTLSFAYSALTEEGA